MLPSLLLTGSLALDNPGSKLCRPPWTRPSWLSFRCQLKENPSGRIFNSFNSQELWLGCWPGLQKPWGFAWMLLFSACFSACGFVFPLQVLMATALCAMGSRTASGITLGPPLAAATARSAAAGSVRSSLLGLRPRD